MIELSAAGVVFTPRGVEFSSWPPECAYGHQAENERRLRPLVPVF
jgi:hypothetical protein